MYLQYKNQFIFSLLPRVKSLNLYICCKLTFYLNLFSFLSFLFALTATLYAAMRILIC